MGERAPVPGPAGKRFIGDILAYEQDRIGWLTRTRADFGDIVRLAPNAVVIHDPEDIHRVLAETNDAFILDGAVRDDARTLRNLVGSLDEWQQIRRHTWHVFGREVVGAHLRRIDTILADRIAATAGSDLDVFATAQRLCGEASADFLFGGDGPVVDEVDQVERLFWQSLDMARRREARLRWAPRRAAGRARHLNEGLLGQLRARVARRRSTAYDGPPRDFLDLLLRRETADRDERVVAVLRISMIASHGIPGAALSWALLRYANDATIRDRIRDEVTSTDDVTDLPFTTAMVREVLRLHPPAWLLNRRVMRPTVVAGYHLRPDEQVMFSPYLVHRDPRWWSRPDTFDPQRWLGPQPPHARHAYLPMGGGTRVCPGGHLGIVQLVLTLARFARDYTVTLPPLDRVGCATQTLLLPVGLRGQWDATGAGMVPPHPAG